MATDMSKGTRLGRDRRLLGRLLGRLLLLPLLAVLLSACATQPTEAPPPPPGYYYPPYGYYDVPPWDPYYDPWFWSDYDGFGYCCGFGWGAGFYGFYGGGYHPGWGSGWGHAGGSPGHGPGWGRPPWGGRPFPRPLPPGAGRGGFHPRYAPHPTHSFSHFHR